MASENESGRGCGCGCFTIVLEAIGFMLICNFFGCEWAERGTQRLVKKIIADTFAAIREEGDAK